MVNTACSISIVMSVVYDCINKMSGMEPSNPANQKAKLNQHKRMVRCSNKLMHCFWSLQANDYKDALHYANDGMAELNN